MGQSILEVADSTTIALGDAGTVDGNGRMHKVLKQNTTLQLIATGTVTFQVYGASSSASTFGDAALTLEVTLTDEAQLYDITTYAEHVGVAITASSGSARAFLGAEYA